MRSKKVSKSFYRFKYHESVCEMNGFLIWLISYDSYSMCYIIWFMRIAFTKSRKKVLVRYSTEPLKIHHQIKFHVIGCVGVERGVRPIKEHHVMLVMFWHWILSQIKFRDNPLFSKNFESSKKFSEKVLGTNFATNHGFPGWSLAKFIQSMLQSHLTIKRI